jgi:Domain of unknown function (DUF4304)
MTIKNTLGEAFETVVKMVGIALLPLGFKRNGQMFRLFEEGNCGIIEFQRSKSNSNYRLLFTLNLGVVCGELLDPDILDIKKARVIDAHLQERIGFILPYHDDKWWEISELTDPSSLGKEMVDCLLTRGVPYIKNHIKTSALLSLWESGESPGLTSLQSSHYLEQIKRLRSTGV